MNVSSFGAYVEPFTLERQMTKCYPERKVQKKGISLLDTLHFKVEKIIHSQTGRKRKLQVEKVANPIEK